MLSRALSMSRVPKISTRLATLLESWPPAPRVVKARSRVLTRALARLRMPTMIPALVAHLLVAAAATAAMVETTTTVLPVWYSTQLSSASLPLLPLPRPSDDGKRNCGPGGFLQLGRDNARWLLSMAPSRGCRCVSSDHTTRDLSPLHLRNCLGFSVTGCWSRPHIPIASHNYILEPAC
jgi:hypothetical protein